MRRTVEEENRGVRVGDQLETDLDFPDDVVLLADTWMVLVSLVARMEEVTQRLGINISIKKSEVMLVSREEVDLNVNQLEFRGECMKQVKEFKYLGSMFTSDGGHKRDIQ
jgi:hypothetical protein